MSEEGIQLKCPNTECGYEWTYRPNYKRRKGNVKINRKYTCCPICRSWVNIDRAQRKG